MTYGYSKDPELDPSTNRVMMWGVVLLGAMVLAFPAYLAHEPSAREQSRADNLESLAAEGKSVWKLNCATCHGDTGEGVSAPALNSSQFLTAATNEQIVSLVSVGVPGTAMSPWGQDFAGPLTSEQVKAVAVFVREWETDAPDVPDWRTPGQG